MVYFVAAIIFIAGLYSVRFVGITGGPNHGEHPFLVTIVHFIIFYFATDAWPRNIYNLYFWLLIFCFAASIVGFGNSDYAKSKSRFRLARGILSIAYLGFVILYLSVHDVI